MPTVQARMTAPQARDLVRRLVYGLTGKAVNVPAVVQGIQLRAGMAMQARIQQDFVTKARGGTGEDGIKWQPLKRSTIAQRRTTPGELKSLGITGKRERGLLTPRENQRWKMLFATRRAWLMAKFGMGPQEAGALAAQIAWATLKKEGAKTKLEVLGGRDVEKLRDTGELLRSFSPGVNTDGAILRTEPGAVIVGTRKKPWHHRGTAKLPARPFWPDGEKHPFPENYLDPVVEATRRGVMEALMLVMRGAA